MPTAAAASGGDIGKAGQADAGTGAPSSGQQARGESIPDGAVSGGGGASMSMDVEEEAMPGLRRDASGISVRVRSETLTSADGSNQSRSGGSAVEYEDVVVGAPEL